MDQQEIEQVEIELVLEALFQRYGYDFRSYARPSIERRIRHFVATRGGHRISDLIAPLMHDEVATLCRKGTEMWVRGPDGRQCMRATVEF